MMQVLDVELVEPGKKRRRKGHVLRTILHQAAGHTYVVRYVVADEAQINQAKCYVCIWLSSDREHCPLTAADALAILQVIV